MSEFKISVIIPTKNRREALWRSLDSVVLQTLAPCEIIVVDDGSSFDISKELQAKFPSIKLFKNNVSQGGAAARNRGALESHGDFIAFLDSDDEWLANHLESKLQILEGEKADGVFGTFILIKGEKEIPISFKGNYRQNGNIGNSILSAVRFDSRTSTFVFKRSSFLQVKFDENLRKHQDWDFAINFDKDFNFILDPNPTVKIFVEQGEERMSHKLQHDSSFYFIDKNSKLLDSDNIFMFCMKQIMRSQLSQEPKSIIDQYLSVAGYYYNNLKIRNKIIFLLMKPGIFNLGTLYKLLNKIKS